MRKLFYSDNLQILREQIADESVDLIYFDPPFNAKRNLVPPCQTAAPLYVKRCAPDEPHVMSGSE